MFIGKNHVTYSFHPTLSSIAQVPSGTLITFETQDALGGQIKSEADKLEGLDFSKVNPATGPVAIADAEPGDALKIDILEIKTAPQGILLAVPGLGVLGDRVTNPETRIVEIGEHNIEFAQRKLPLHPMIGVIGVATESEEIPCGTPGDHGGNMDTRDICPGNSLYLPVFQPGGLLAIGDVHATMADGESCGTGVECGAEVLVRVTVIKEMGIKRPLLETPSEIQTIASAESTDAAARLGVSDMVEYLMRTINVSFNEAYMLVSMVGQVKISQLVDPQLTVRVAVPKSIL